MFIDQYYCCKVTWNQTTRLWMARAQFRIITAHGRLWEPATVQTGRIRRETRSTSFVFKKTGLRATRNVFRCCVLKNCELFERNCCLLRDSRFSVANLNSWIFIGVSWKRVKLVLKFDAVKHISGLYLDNIGLITGFRDWITRIVSGSL